MSTALSRPKNQIRILLLEGISDTAVNALKSTGYTNIDRRSTALDGAELRAALQGVSMLGIRSRTQLTAAAIDGVRSLMAVGCFSIGTNQVDLAAARSMGIPVFNAPFSNTRSVAELTMAEIVMLFRRIFRIAAAHAAVGTRARSAPTRSAARPSASSATATSAASSASSPKASACA